MKYTVPNWYQSLIARQVGLDPESVAVSRESEHNISFLQYKTRKELLVDKKTGEVTDLTPPYITR